MILELFKALLRIANVDQFTLVFTKSIRKISIFIIVLLNTRDPNITNKN